MLMTPEDLGNYTYGYLRAAFDFPYEVLLAGSYYTAGFPIKGPELHNEFRDWYYITIGYNDFKIRMG